MQTLYALDDHSLNGTETDGIRPSLGAIVHPAYRLLDEKIHRSSNLFTLMLLYVAKVAQYAEADARQRASKYLPTDADLKVNTKISGNTFLWELLENTTFSEKVKEEKLESKVAIEWVKKLYNRLASSDVYKAYIERQNRDKAAEKMILQHIWKQEMLGNESFIEYIDDEWSDWEDDGSMIIMLIDNYFRSPRNVNFLQFISAEKKEYAYDLVKTVLDKDAHCMELIRPKLKNWEADRVAVIDLILLKMGTCELLYFPTIPTKVTINEYIEIAKHYSTPQSGQFVNGVLDNLLKELTTEQKIRKVDRQK